MYLNQPKNAPNTMIYTGYYKGRGSINIESLDFSVKCDLEVYSFHRKIEFVTNSNLWCLYISTLKL
jgi:hypothetical protein